MESQPHGSLSTATNTGITKPGVTRHYVLVAIRGMLTTSWFLFLLAAILVGSSLLASIYTDAWSNSDDIHANLRYETGNL